MFHKLSGFRDDVSAYPSFHKYKTIFLIIKIKHNKYQSCTINNPHTPKATVTKYYNNKLKSDYYYCYLLQAESKLSQSRFHGNVSKYNKEVSNKTYCISVDCHCKYCGKQCRATAGRSAIVGRNEM